MNTIDELVASSSQLIEAFSGSADEERIYNRIWYCLRWQQADPDPRIMDILCRLYGIFVRASPADRRMAMYLATKEEVHSRRFTPAAFVLFILNEIDEGIASTAAIDLLAYSVLDGSSLPVGFGVLKDIIEHGMCKLPGALFGAAVTWGDSNLRSGLESMLPNLSPADMKMAARMQTGFISHSTIQFWLSLSLRLANQANDGAQSVLGSCASALVRSHQTAKQAMVADTERLYPAFDFDPPIRAREWWTLEEYGELIEPQLNEILEIERKPKVFGEVRRVWCPWAGSPERYVHPVIH